MKKEVWIWVLLGIIFSTISVFADPVQIKIEHLKPQGDHSIGIGSQFALRLPANPQIIDDALFLGKLVNPDGSLASNMFLDLDAEKVYYISSSDLKGVSFDEHAQPVLKQYDQVDGTCTGYAIDHYMQQMRLMGFKNKNLDETLSTEKGRSQLLVESVNNYYLALRHKFSINGIMNQFGKRFGFSCEKKIFTDPSKALDYLNSHLERQVPVMLSFNVGTNMTVADFKLYNYPKLKRSLDNRLWTPRKIGERNGGGHSVVAVAGVEFKGSEKLVMLDSDWDAPRIWNASEYLTDHTALDEIEFYTCE